MTNALKALERFYFELGCRRLGDLIREEYTPLGLALDTT
jgi:hypothetical protein